MKVIRPTSNPLSRGYSSTHKGYDFRGLNLPDEIRAGMAGTVIERVDLYTTNWTNNGTLTTKDYGNYVKIKHTDNSFELHAHLKHGSALNVGTAVLAGQLVGHIGNTGNSTGPHLHSEYRDSANKNLEVEFIEYVPPVDTCEKELEEMRESRNSWKRKADEYYQSREDERKTHSQTIQEKNTQIETFQKQSQELTVQLSENGKVIEQQGRDIKRLSDENMTLGGQHKMLISSVEKQEKEIIKLKQKIGGKLSEYSRLDLIKAVIRL